MQMWPWAPPDGFGAVFALGATLHEAFTSCKRRPWGGEHPPGGFVAVFAPGATLHEAFSSSKRRPGLGAAPLRFGGGFRAQRDFA